MAIETYQLYYPPFEGGFCRVFKASRNDKPGKFFAIKMPKDENNPEHIKALERELKVLLRIKHPNIIKLISSNLNHKPPFIVLEYLSGGNLRSRVGKLSYEETVFVLCRISSALGAFHQAGGFHRDVKPENILVNNTGDVILADVNIANVPSNTSKLTRSIGGTDGYIDPWLDNQSFDSKADIFSLGITIIELLTGENPILRKCKDGIILNISDLPIDNKEHKKAFFRLIKAMISGNRELRPDADTVQQYSMALLNSGPLPLLPTPKISQKSYSKPPSITGILVVGAFAILLFVGIAALCRRR
ncbi:MAG TPA: serine/threonine-protein kinase [bacterium]